MFEKLGIAGILGFLVLLAGIALITWQNLYIGAGIAFVVAGLGLVTYGMVKNLAAALGMGGMMG